MYNIWSNIGLKSLKNLTKTLKNLTITLKYLTKNFEKLDNFAEKNAEGVIITPKKGLYETLSKIMILTLFLSHETSFEMIPPI